MKRIALILLCLAVFLLAMGAAGAFFLLSPRGVLRSEGPDQVMHQALASRSREDWRDDYVRLCAPVTTEFEDAAAVAGRLFDAAAPGDAFTFREVPGTAEARTARYIVSCAQADLLLASVRFEDGRWTMETQALDALRPLPRTVTITVPEGTRVRCNGIAVSDAYMTDGAVPYPDLTELERRFDACPHLVRYEVPGLFEAAEIRAENPAGLLLLYADGTNYSYTLPDAGSRSFAVTAPAEATVRVCGAVLEDRDVTGVSAFPTRLTVPEELQPMLPFDNVYTAGGLYSVPEISAVLPDGTALVPEVREDGVMVFSLPGSQTLYEAHHETVETFLRNLCEYGAGRLKLAGASALVQRPSQVYDYMARATDSLYWTQGVSTSYREISSHDYLPLGEDAFICRGHVENSTSTRHEAVDFSLELEMLWVNVDGSWRVSDLAYVDFVQTKPSAFVS